MTKKYEIKIENVLNITVDTENKKIESVDVLNEKAAENIFRGSIGNSFNYNDLESQMNFYNYSAKKSLEEILDELKPDKFFYALKPSLRVEIKEL